MVEVWGISILECFKFGWVVYVFIFIRRLVIGWGDVFWVKWVFVVKVTFEGVDSWRLYVDSIFSIRSKTFFSKWNLSSERIIVFIIFVERIKILSRGIRWYLRIFLFEYLWLREIMFIEGLEEIMLYRWWVLRSSYFDVFEILGREGSFSGGGSFESNKWCWILVYVFIF